MGSDGKKREPFWLGGAAACMAVCFSEDLGPHIHWIKQNSNRMQVLKSQSSMLHVLYRFAARDGIPSLWTGLSASFLRQGTYSTARFGIHSFLSQKALAYTGEKKLSVSWNIACAGVAGGIAGLVGNPAEVVLVRMCADGAKSPAQRFGYSNAGEALARVSREEGFQAFGKGITANIARSVLMNVSQIATYASAKQYLMGSLGLEDDIRTHAGASLMAGTMATTLCAPADVLKSRLQASAGKDGLVSVLQSGLREEGVRFLMRGWTPAWLRLTQVDSSSIQLNALLTSCDSPHTVLTFVFMEKLRQLTTLGLPWLHTQGAQPAQEQELR